GSNVAIVKSFYVFNRWGESMFELFNFQSNNPSYGWDGTHRTQRLNTGVYVYVAEVEFIDGEVVIFKGDVTLIR
ncbi:MAG TPA: gliding motility-associated C-terminal domain-containing protein, partial [Saprospiraceae bacterium]|nr:gliding motility-associated C-terminal domain-containing protein [Saprospiraceae bacterium]